MRETRSGGGMVSNGNGMGVELRETKNGGRSLYCRTGNMVSKAWWKGDKECRRG